MPRRFYGRKQNKITAKSNSPSSSTRNKSKSPQHGTRPASGGCSAMSESASSNSASTSMSSGPSIRSRQQSNASTRTSQCSETPHDPRRSPRLMQRANATGPDARSETQSTVIARSLNGDAIGRQQQPEEGPSERLLPPPANQLMPTLESSSGRVTLDDAYAFLDQVKFAYRDQRQKYDTMLDCLKQYKDTPNMKFRVCIQKLSNLFIADHPELLEAFNKFLRSAGKLEIQQNQQVRFSRTLDEIFDGSESIRPRLPFQ